MKFLSTNCAEIVDSCVRFVFDQLQFDYVWSSLNTHTHTSPKGNFYFLVIFFFVHISYLTKSSSMPFRSSIYRFTCCHPLPSFIRMSGIILNEWSGQWVKQTSRLIIIIIIIIIIINNNIDIPIFFWSVTGSDLRSQRRFVFTSMFVAEKTWNKLLFPQYISIQSILLASAFPMGK